jgi:hypothetical protein
MITSLGRGASVAFLLGTFSFVMPAGVRAAGDSWEQELRLREQQDEWREQIAADREAWDQQRQQDEDWREQMKAWHQEMADAGMLQPEAGQQQAAGALNPQAAMIALQQLAAAQVFIQQVQARQQAVFQALALNPPIPKPAAPPVVKANPPKPAPASPAPATNEERASGKFDLAMMLAKAGKLNKAEEYCQFIVKAYPGTQGAMQAQAYLTKPAGS